MKNIATFIRSLDGFSSDARLYRISPPISYDPRCDGDNLKTEYVVVSATYVMFSGPETYIFPSDKDGNILHWGELDGSYKGELNHIKALENAGYKVSKSKKGIT